MNHLTCKIHWTTSTADEQFDPELWKKWEQERKAHLSDSVHPVRLKASLLARMSYEKLKAQYNPCFNPSYSHTDLVGLCSVTENPHEFSGIDIEKVDRKIPEKSHSMFINDQDEELPLLHLWCLKEAAFKALSNSFERSEPKLLKEISILKNGELHYKKVKGSWELKELDIQGQKYLLALTTLLQAPA